MNKIVSFIKGSIDELKYKVSWSKFSELQSTSILVLVASLIFALVVGVIDYAFKNVVDLIYNSPN